MIACFHAYLFLAMDLLDRGNTASDVWGETGYRSKTNEVHLADHGFLSCLHRKKPAGQAMPDATRRANARRSRLRSGGRARLRA